MIRKIVGIITLTGFSLFVGCDDNTLTPILFELDARLPVDGNGYYHLTLDQSKWQTKHRNSGTTYRDGHRDTPMCYVKFGWASNFYWAIGDTFGYVIANNGLTDDLVYVGYDTTYITWFGGWEVPIVNGASYSSEPDGEVNTMIAPVRTMIGDTATFFYGYYDDWRSEETVGEFNIIFD